MTLSLRDIYKYCWHRSVHVQILEHLLKTWKRTKHRLINNMCFWFSWSFDLHLLHQIPYAPWCWKMNPNIYPGPKSPSFVGKYTSTMVRILCWLVVYLPLWKIWKSVGFMIPNIWKNNSNDPNHQPLYPLVMINIAINNGPVEILDLSIKHGGSFHSFLYVYQRVIPIHGHL